MHLAILAASGGTGLALTQQALQRGLGQAKGERQHRRGHRLAALLQPAPRRGQHRAGRTPDDPPRNRQPSGNLKLDYAPAIQRADRGGYGRRRRLLRHPSTPTPAALLVSGLVRLRLHQDRGASERIQDLAEPGGRHLPMTGVLGVPRASGQQHG